MAKDKSATDAGTAKPKVDTEALRAEVKAFASQLGFSSGSFGNFEYDDFAPEKATKPVKQPQQQPAKSAQKDATKQQQKQKHDRQQQQYKQQNAGQKGQDRQQGNQQQNIQQLRDKRQEEKEAQHLDAVRSRTWVESVGPRPGEARGKSLLGKDEPTIWYEAAAALPKLDPSSAPQLDDDAAEQLRQRAEALLDREQQLFEKEMGNRNAADARWLAQVRKSGTTADKIAAMSLMVSSSATGNIKSLDGLLGLMGKTAGGKHVVVSAMEALQELFLTALLPGRKLKVLEQQPLQVLPAGKEGERCLLLWAVEDAVKRRYQQYVQLLQKCSTDNLDFIKEKATKVISRLLTAKPEGEQALLAALVNKLGDPSRKIASDAGYLMGQLLLEHPAMKPVVVREVERFMFRPGLTDRARYYSVTFLNQLPLSHRPHEGGSTLAQKLIDIYFSLFKLLLEGKLGNAAARQQRQAEQQKGKHGKGKPYKGKKNGKKQDDEDDKDATESLQQAGELDARMLSALITGVRRAFPYVESDKVEPMIDAHGEKLFKLVHTAPFTVSLQALMLMHQLLSGRNAVSDRFYRALYAVLLAEGARGAAGVRAPQFMSLLVKAMRSDVSIKRVAAFAKRLLQVACHAPSHWAAGALLLLSEVLKAHPGLWAAVQQPEDTAGQAESFKDAAAGLLDSDDDDEVFKDAPDSDEGEQQQQQQQQRHRDGETAAAAPAAANGHANGLGADAAAAAAKWPKDDYYDMRKREPLYASAEVSCWWELLLLSKHSHPSVAAFAKSLLAGSPVQYAGDPLRDMGLPAFLDKFVNKKPKAAPRGTSLMQPSHSLTAAAAASGVSDDAAALSSRPSDITVLGSEAFAALAEADVSSDQLFFHRFFNLQSVKAKQTAASRAKARREAAEKAAGLGGVLGSDDEDESDAEVGSEDIDDVEIDAALQEAEGVGDDELGDPDIGFDYDKLMSAMEGDDDDADSDDGADGEPSDDEDEGASDENEDAAAGSSDDAEDDGSSGSSEDEDGDDSDADDWVMMEGAEAAAAAAEDGNSKKAKKKRKLQDAGDIDDADLEDVNVLDLPSPSSSDDEEQQKASRKKRKKQQQQLEAADTEGDDLDLDVDLDDVLGGSDDDDDGDDVAAAAAGSKRSKTGQSKLSKQQLKRNRGGAGLFASADGYEDFFKEYEMAAAAADKEDGGEAAGSKGGGRKKHRRPQQHRQKGSSNKEQSKKKSS